MMSEQGEQWLDDHFPMEDSFADFSGKQREFVLTLQPHPRGYFLRATEKRQSHEDDGYHFAAYSPTDPFFALGLLRDKIRRGLATRYLTSEQGSRHFSHDRVKGRIGSGGVVVDGEFISFDEFGTMLQTYEGSQFSLTIVDPYDEA
jgi:hypothetical protein